jgi:hypothetical protein
MKAKMKFVKKNGRSLPDTILRLASLKSGQSMVYYHGNLPADIDRCNPFNNKKGAVARFGAPSCKALLENICATATKLAEKNKVTLSTKPGKLGAIKYIATGI